MFRRDVKAGSTVLVSRADGANGDPTNSDSTDVATDAAGDIVAFSSSASNLTPISFVNEQIFVRNLNTSHTQFASGLGGLDRPAATQNPSLDAAGDEVAFIADGTPFSNTSAEALVRRLTASTPVLASRANGVAGAPANGDTRSVALDPTGRCLAFTTASSNLGDGFGSFDFDSVHLRVLSGQCPLPPPPPPALTLLKIAPRKVHTHGKTAGARITFHLSTRATVTLGFTQLRSGRRHNGKCVPGRKHGKRCTVSTLRGRLTVAGRAGANRIHISGKLKGKRLPAGRYRLTATPAGGRTRSLTFTVAR